MLALISIYFRLRLKLLQSALVGMLAMHLHSKMKNKHSLQIRIIFAAIGPTLHLTMFPFLPGLWSPWVGPCMPLSSGLPSTFTGKAWCFFKTISYWIHQIWFWRQEADFKQAPLIGISCCLLSLKAIVSFLLALFVALNKKKQAQRAFSVSSVLCCSASATKLMFCSFQFIWFISGGVLTLPPTSSLIPQIYVYKNPAWNQELFIKNNQSHTLKISLSWDERGTRFPVIGRLKQQLIPNLKKKKKKSLVILIFLGLKGRYFCFFSAMLVI